MTAGNLWLDVYLPHLLPSCCVNKVYTLVFNQLHQVLRDNGAGVLTLQSFVAAQQNTAAILLNEHPERSKYYYLEVDHNNLILPATPLGEKYYIEFWRRELTGAFNRTEDILEEVRPLYWSGQFTEESIISQAGRDALVEWTAHLALTYDSETLAVYFMGHLERNGQLVTDPTSLELLWLDATGASIAHTVQTTQLTNAPGVFAWSQPNIDLPADRTGALLCSILHQGITHTTAQYSNAWD